jgi:hypothetical protein
MAFASTLRPTFFRVLSRHAAAATAVTIFGLHCASASAASILFIGNSFTYAQGSAVQTFQPGTVTDLNGSGIGGIPALFKSFTQQAGLDYTVSLETVGGSGLDLHYNTKQALINKPWDNVVMHTFSTLNASSPGNPAQLIQYTGLLTSMFQAQNPNVNVNLMATWSRADQTYPASGAWYGSDIYQMGKDVRAGYDLAAAAVPAVRSVIPVGDAWNLAMMEGFADINPYNGIDAGKVNLWASDSYHASMFGSYIEALTIFGDLTGLDPRSLGDNELAAKELGISAAQVRAMQQIAFTTLAVNAVPEPSTYVMMAIGIAAVAVWRRRRVTGQFADGEAPSIR